MTTLFEATGKKFTVFSPTCCDVMDLFLNDPTIYYTPTTAALSLDKPLSTIKSCMNLLKSNSYLTKVTETGSTYHITKENMEFWVTDFRNHILSEQEEINQLQKTGVEI